MRRQQRVLCALTVAVAAGSLLLGPMAVPALAQDSTTSSSTTSSTTTTTTRVTTTTTTTVPSVLPPPPSTSSTTTTSTSTTTIPPTATTKPKPKNPTTTTTTTTTTVPPLTTGGGPTEVNFDGPAVPPGGSGLVSGRGCPPNSRVGFRLEGEDLGDEVVGPGGEFEVALPIPQLPVGRHSLVATCGGGQSQVPIDVALAVNSTGTGSSALATLLVFFLLLGVVLRTATGSDDDS